MRVRPQTVGLAITEKVMPAAARVLPVQAMPHVQEMVSLLAIQVITRRQQQQRLVRLAQQVIHIQHVQAQH